LIQVNHADVIRHEMIVLEGVRFQLIMYHPFRALTGFIDDARLYYKSIGKELKVTNLQELHAKATSCINDLILTTAPLQFNPPYLALAGLRIAVEKLGPEGVGELNVDDYIQNSKFSKGKTANLDDILATLNTIDELSKKQIDEKTTDQTKVKALYKKLKVFYKDILTTTSSSSTTPAISTDTKEPKKRKHKKDRDSKKSKKSKKEKKKDQ